MSKALHEFRARGNPYGGAGVAPARWRRAAAGVAAAIPKDARLQGHARYAEIVVFSLTRLSASPKLGHRTVEGEGKNMESDPEVLLALLAVRMQGADAPAKLGIFTKLKPYLKAALNQHLVKEEKIEVIVTGKKKTTAKSEAVINLTDEGEKYLEAHAGAAAQAAAIHAQAHKFQQQLQADRAGLREELLASVKSKAKGIDPSKEIAALAKKLDELAKQLAALEAKVKPTDESDPLARIDAAFAKLDQKLQARFGVAAPVKAAPTTASLRSVLRDAYETLCMFIEFDSGIVEMPRLYHEARKAMPNLTVHAFHQELEGLWSQKVLELKVLNEVRSAKEPDKAIRRGDNLYYFVFWPKP
jgi:hypothetical protein